MPHVEQELTVLSIRKKKKNNKKARKEVILVNKKSVGTIWINGVPYTYNPHLVYNTLDVTWEEMTEQVEEEKARKKIIIIKRK